MYGAAMPLGAFPMQPWPPHMMPPGFPVDMGAGMGSLAGDTPNSVLKLKGLPFAATAQDVSAFFDGFALLSCTIHHGADGRPSGMAYAVFSSPDEAQRALSTKDRAFIGERFVRILRVAHSEMDEQLGGRQLTGFGYAGYPGLMPPEAIAAMNAAYAYGLYPPPGMYPPMGGGFPGPGFQLRMPPAQASQAGATQRGPAGTTVKMRGLPFRVSPAEVLSFFTGFDFVADTLRMGTDAMGRPSGEGWLSFGSEEEAARAARELNRQYLGSRYLELTVV